MAPKRLFDGLRSPLPLPAAQQGLHLAFQKIRPGDDSSPQSFVARFCAARWRPGSRPLNHGNVRRTHGSHCRCPALQGPACGLSPPAFQARLPRPKLPTSEIRALLLRARGHPSLVKLDGASPRDPQGAGMGGPGLPDAGGLMGPGASEERSGLARPTTTGLGEPRSPPPAETPGEAGRLARLDASRLPQPPCASRFQLQWWRAIFIPLIGTSNSEGIHI